MTEKLTSRRVVLAAAAFVAAGYIALRYITLPANGFAAALFGLELVFVAASFAALHRALRYRNASNGPFCTTKHTMPERLGVVVPAAPETRLSDVQHTLVACMHLDVDVVVAISPDADQSLRAVAARYGASVVEAHGPAPHRFARGAQSLQNRVCLWLSAGSTPGPDVFEAAALVGDATQVVQGRRGFFDASSLVHLSRRGDADDAYETAWSASLGAATVAVVHGNGSVWDRRAAARCVDRRALRAGFDSSPVAAVADQSWEVVREPSPRSLLDLIAVRRTRAAQRLGCLAALRRPLPVRAAGFVLSPLFAWLGVAAAGVVTAAAVSGEPLLTAPVLFVAAVFTAVRLWAVSRAHGVGFAQWVLAQVRRFAADVCAPLPAKFTTAPLWFITAAVCVVCAAVVYCAWASVLDAPQVVVAAAPAVGFAAVAAAAFTRCRSDQRRIQRFPAALDVTIDGRAAVTTNVSQTGAGMVASFPVPANRWVSLCMVVPQLDGSLASVNAPAQVRHCAPRGDATFSIGVEFAGLDGAAADAIVEFCAVGHLFTAADETTVEASPSPSSAPAVLRTTLVSLCVATAALAAAGLPVRSIASDPVFALQRVGSDAASVNISGLHGDVTWVAVEAPPGWVLDESRVPSGWVCGSEPGVWVGCERAGVPGSQLSVPLAAKPGTRSAAAGVVWSTTPAPWSGGDQPVFDSPAVVAFPDVP